VASRKFIHWQGTLLLVVEYMFHSSNLWFKFVEKQAAAEGAEGTDTRDSWDCNKLSNQKNLPCDGDGTQIILTERRCVG
jgi:hypothetical protein